MELQVLRTIRKHAMLVRGDHVLVAASGGADSMALLHCLHDLAGSLELNLTAAHLNHCLRGAESDRDEAFVRAACAAMHVPFLGERVDLPAGAGGRNIEEAAREARYAFLRRAAEHAGANRIATGHTRNDQAETVLLRMLRGSGLNGLEGIHPTIGDRVVRPLISCSRSAILEFLAQRDIAYREDSSNRDVRYRRNRVRHELIPYLENHFNPRLIEALAREAGLAHAAYDFLGKQAVPEYQKMRARLRDGIALPAADLAAAHPALQFEVVRCALRDTLGALRGIDSVHLEEILGLCTGGRSGRVIELPRGAAARRNLDRIEICRSRGRDDPPYMYRLSLPGRCPVPEAELEFVAVVVGEGIPPADSSADAVASARLDPETLPSVLQIRSRRNGDRYGGQGHRKVKKMLLNARIPMPARASLPMIAAGDIVVWIPGFKPAKTFAAGTTSGRSVLIEARKFRPK